MLTVDVQRHGGGVVDVPWQGEEGTEAERPGHLLPLRPPVVAVEVEVEVVENDARQLLDRREAGPGPEAYLDPVAGRGTRVVAGDLVHG